MKRLFTGGHGLLGTEIQQYFPNDLFPTEKQLDITKPKQLLNYFVKHDFDVVVHMAAATATKEIETNDKARQAALTVNIIGTSNLVNLCMEFNKKIIYISTDYVFRGDEGNYKEHDALNPVNKYAWSKLGGECAVHLHPNSLIIRTSFCSNEFPYECAFNDQWTTRMPVDEAAEKISHVIKEKHVGVKHVFGRKQTVYELAHELSPDKIIRPISIDTLSDYPLPKDTSLSTIDIKEEE